MSLAHRKNKELIKNEKLKVISLYNQKIPLIISKHNSDRDKV